MTPLWNRARERFFQTDLKIWSDRAASGAGENIGSTAWNMEEDTQYEYASNCGVVWTPASTTPSEIAFIPTVTLGSVEDTLFTRGATLAMDWDPEGTPLSASYNTKRVGVTGIQSTSWESVVNGAVLDNNPEECGGGKRIYPETDLSGTLKNTVNIRVTLENAIPEGMTGSLRLMVLDPMNQCKDGNNQSVGSFSSWQYDSWQCDNYGSDSLTNSLYFAEETISNTALLTITQANPGDNYIVVAAPDDNLYESAFIYIAVNSTTDYKTPYFLTSDGSSPVPEKQKTELLTVWRTLWLEVDQLKYGDKVAPALFENYQINTDYSLAQDTVSQVVFGPACVKIAIVPQDDSILPVSQRTTSSYTSTTFPYPQRNYYCTLNFWTIHVVIAFHYEIDNRAGHYCQNNICLYSDVIKEVDQSIRKPGDEHDSTPFPGWSTDYKYDILSHELVHSFGYNSGNQSDSWHDLTGLMTPQVNYSGVNDLSCNHIRKIQSSARPLENTSNN
ncbi:MAG: hypothetical protein J6J31_13145 [Thermoguttaceae bacterium]|nr:hypothetical protein [Thermoguttaceae bacterium]